MQCRPSHQTQQRAELHHFAKKVSRGKAAGPHCFATVQGSVSIGAGGRVHSKTDKYKRSESGCFSMSNRRTVMMMLALSELPLTEPACAVEEL
mmetsp:Transcript_75673/g.179806  ORF Transcript_75673/g.179806 Transcript_75673/m.179806 type:complete len:93 (-) Transcript_75673:169-447(-)